MNGDLFLDSLVVVLHILFLCMQLLVWGFSNMYCYLFRSKGKFYLKGAFCASKMHSRLLADKALTSDFEFVRYFTRLSTESLDILHEAVERLNLQGIKTWSPIVLH